MARRRAEHETDVQVKGGKAGALPYGVGGCLMTGEADNLRKQFLHPDNFRLAWQRVRKNKARP